MVYEKSVLGYNEFTNQKRTLHVRERQVLLLVNGVRSISELEKFFRKEQLAETIQKLESGGFIQKFNSTPVTNNRTENVTLTAHSLFHAEITSTPIALEKIAAVKAILIEAADDYLGLMGRGIKENINNSNDLPSLRSCISNWHMAMRESKLGRESASFLMEQIHQILENNMLNTAPVSTNTH
ncbi:hypothetical protein GALL_60280 [mine drainage metagenome]|uniref:Uncharacterized protein n=1 Tax=mine drainage metagenome TaxID=410659 RepID=A0A1J5SUX9_9ZZZZ